MVFGLSTFTLFYTAIGLVITVYLDAFVTIVQAFLKVPALHAFAPKGTEPPFAVAQACLLLVFVALAVAVARKFHPVRAGG